MITLLFAVIKYSTLFLFKHSNDGYVLETAFGLINWFAGAFSFNELLSYAAKYIFFLLLVIPIIIITDINVIKNNILYVAIFFFIHLQPLAAGPGIATSGNIPRLCSYSLPFLIIFIAESSISLKSWLCYIFIVILISFHHQTSIIYFVDYGRNVFMIIIFVSVLLSLIIKHLLNKKVPQ